MEPAVLRLFQEKGIDVKEVHPRVRTKRQGFAMEIDILYEVVFYDWTQEQADLPSGDRHWVGDKYINSK